MGWFDRFTRGTRKERTEAAATGAADGPGKGPNAQPEGFRLPAALGLDPQVEAALREQAWRFVVRGDDDADAFAECQEDEAEAWGVGEDVIRAAFLAVVAARRAQQAAWTAMPKTALTRAFEALAARGVVARENFSCCGTCASAEIFNERDDSRNWRGYVYYHQQDTEGLLDDRSTYIGYGAFLDAWTTEAEWTALPDAERERRYERIVTALMREDVIPVLEAHGATVTWDGSLGTRIRLDNVDFFVPLP